MATRRYSIDPGEEMHLVVEAAGAAVATKNIELTVDFGTLGGLTPAITGAQGKMMVLIALQKLHAYIETKATWPPA